MKKLLSFILSMEGKVNKVVTVFLFWDKLILDIRKEGISCLASIKVVFIFFRN